MIELFRSRGLKVTPQRVCIFELLHDSRVHPTAEAIHLQATARMPTMSLKTVYQTLNDLARMGELSQLDLGTGSSRFDPDVTPHHHLVCTSCGKIRDLHADFDGLALEATDAQGFVVGAADVVFRGTCTDCQPPEPATQQEHAPHG